MNSPNLIFPPSLLPPHQRGRVGVGALGHLLVLIIILFSCQSRAGYSFERPVFAVEKNTKDEYLGLFFRDKKVGYFHGSAYDITLNGENAHYLVGDAVIKLEMEGEKLYTVLKEEIVFDKAYKTVFFSYSQKIGESVMELAAVRKGADYALKTTSGGKTQEDVIKEDFLPLSGAGYIVWKEGIKEGKEHKFRVYAEALQKFENLTVTIGAKTMEGGKAVYPLRQKLGNIEITSYVLENGDTYREESIQGFTMKKLDKKEALKLDEKAVSFYDILSISFIPADAPLDKDFKEITLELSGLDGKVNIPASPFQKVEKQDGKFILTNTKEPQSAGKTTGDLKPYLAKTPKIQKDEPEIKNLAQSITASAKTPAEKAKIIAGWVNKNIRKRLRDKSSALEVLKTKEGECEAHSMLTAALLRSIDIPAKVVGGVAYSKEHRGFLYHAWNEAYLDGIFVPIDATFGEFPAKPYHIKLTEESNMEDIILFLGKLRIKILKTGY